MCGPQANGFKGFLCYFIYQSLLYWSPLVRAQYARRYDGLTPTVQLNDVAFAAHALLLSCITTSQYVPGLWPGFSHGAHTTARGRASSRSSSLPGFSGTSSSSGSSRSSRSSRGASPPRSVLVRAARQPSAFVLGIMGGCVLGVAVVALLVLIDTRRLGNHDPKRIGGAPEDGWCLLDLVYALSYVKLLVTLVKYTPQILANARNRSTHGWSITQILLDVGGGVLSIAQVCIDALRQGHWSGITGNPVKFALGQVSLVYDSIFIVQHYILYRDAPRDDDEIDVRKRKDFDDRERDALLNDDEEAAARRERRLD